MSENPIRDVHDAVADSPDPAQASVRPPGTTPRELRAMQRDVLGKLRVDAGMSVVEIGCGVGLLGVPLARKVARYVGLDFAPQAVRVANERLRAADPQRPARAICLDVLEASEEQMRELGSFDRLLMYAVFHYARNEREAILFIRRTAGLLAPGGLALIGNVPLEDLRVDWEPSGPVPRGLPARLHAASRWVASTGSSPVPLTRGWKARRTLETILKSRSAVEPFEPARLPPNYTLTLTTANVERWLSPLSDELTHRWELPAPGVPLAPARADLILERNIRQATCVELQQLGKGRCSQPTR